MKLAISSNTRTIRLSLIALLPACLFLLGIPNPLSACAMSAVISTSGNLLADFPAQGNNASYYHYNDPWDYFGFLMANSEPYSNSDGYGVVAYSTLSSRLQENDMWFKRIQDGDDFGNVYYTGDYLQGGLSATLPRYDVMDRALQLIQEPVNGVGIAMGHVRNASGLTMGNHPFWFHHARRTYSFMHNGNAGAARTFMIGEISAMNSEVDWFHLHPSNYFNDPNPYRWVDSEVLFHYVISHILACEGDITLGIVNAMLGIRQYLGSSSYNFIMSDGEKLFAFRGSSSSSYQLSYKEGDGWYGIRTKSPYANEIRLRPKELVILSRNAEPRHIMIEEYYGNEVTQQPNPLHITLSPNPASSRGSITLTPVYPFGSGKSPARMEIFNSRGQLLLSREVPNLDNGIPVNLSLGSMSSGIYFCRIRSGGYSTSVRFSVVK